MTDARDSAGELLPDDQRTTFFSCVLRHLRLDELLQLWNVVRGEMSCIGPRPALPVYRSDYDWYQLRRLELRPGMTGWAQVNGNTRLSWDERIVLDVWYVDHVSLWLDLRIILATFRVILFGEHPNQGALQQATQYAERTRANRNESCTSRCG